jgi:hypothetical protein
MFLNSSVFKKTIGAKTERFQYVAIDNAVRIWAIQIDRLTEHLRYLISKYDLGYILVGDKNFGFDRKVAWELTKKTGALGLKW